jgi:NAD(P)-dependent dehydrogenase (short-subunit alcohol dehydrogenase family)
MLGDARRDAPMATDLFNLHGQVAWIVGAGGALGRASALGLAEYGADVAAADLDGTAAEETASQVRALGRRAIGLQLDATDPDAVEAAAERVATELGGPDVMVHGVGINVRKPTLEVTPQEFERVARTNLFSTFYTCQAAGRRMVPRGRGKLVLFTSISSLLGHPGHASYAASKGGMKQLMKVLASEWAPNGVTVNSIAPTYIRSGLTDAYLNQPGNEERIRGNIPMGRLATPRDVVGAVLYLSAPASDFVTGQTIFVSGGRELD